MDAFYLLERFLKKGSILLKRNSVYIAPYLVPHILFGSKDSQNSFIWSIFFISSCASVAFITCSCEFPVNITNKSSSSWQ